MNAIRAEVNAATSAANLPASAGSAGRPAKFSRASSAAPTRRSAADDEPYECRRWISGFPRPASRGRKVCQPRPAQGPCERAHGRRHDGEVRVYLTVLQRPTSRMHRRLASSTTTCRSAPCVGAMDVTDAFLIFERGAIFLETFAVARGSWDECGSPWRRLWRRRESVHRA